MWEGVQHITNYKTDLEDAKCNVSLAEDLNLFFAWFEVKSSGRHAILDRTQECHLYHGRSAWEFGLMESLGKD